MSLKSPAGAEGRMDLASLFCVIGRHGPAVAVAVVVVVVVSVLAGLVLYRRGRRKRAAAAAAVGEGGTGATPEESRSSAESTDVRDEGSSDVKEDDDLIPRDFKLRHRPAAAAPAAEKKPPPYSPLNRDIQAQEKRHVPSDGSGEMNDVRHSCKATDAYAEETNQGLQSHASTTAEMEVEDAVDRRQGAAGDIFKDVREELHDNGSRCKEPEPIHDGSHTDGGTALKAECQEDEDVASDKDVCSFNNRTATRSDSHSAAPINIEDVHATSISCGKSEEENPQSIDCIRSSNNDRLSPEEENKNDSERVVKECVDTQQAEIMSPTSEQEPKLTSTTQDQGDHVTDKAMPPGEDSVLEESDGDVSEEVVEGEDLNTLGAGEVVTHSPQFNEREEEIEQQEEGRLECSRQDGVLYDGAGRGKEKMLTSDDAVVNSQGCDGSSVSLPTLSVPIKVDVHDNGLSGVTADAKAQISGTADFPDFSVGCQVQMEDKTAPSQNDDIEPTILSTEIPSHGTEEVPENNRDGSSMVLTDECDDHEHDPQGQSCYKDQKSFSNEGFEARVGPHPDTADDEPASAISEEIRRRSPSVCEDRQGDGIENADNSAADAVISNRLTARLTSEGLSQPDMMPFSQHQQSSLVENKEELSEVTSCAAPVMTGISPPMCQIHLPSFGQGEQRNKDMASPGVGEESGISSLAVSPDSQDAGSEFDVAVGNMVDCDLQSEGQTEPQNSLFADDAASSVIYEDAAGMDFGPYPSLCFETPHGEHAVWNTFESIVANEDMFGHEIEDGYHRVLDRFTAQISTSFSRFTDDLTILTDMKTIFEVVEIKEEVKTAGSIKQEEGTKADEQEEDYEKTEISIMEATMDYNEWITDSNYPVLPWLNLSAPSFGQDDTKTNQLPSEVCQYTSAVPDATCKDTTYTEVKRTSALSLVDEITESSKKVVAVQPMPQNVNVTFQVHYFTESPYQTVAVTGNQQELGNWKGFIPLESAKDGHWSTEVSLPAESRVEWKFVLLDKGEVCRWEECDNRLLDTGYGDHLLVHRWWGLL